MTPRWARIEQPEPAPAETRPYDLVKEFAIALVVVLVATFALAAVFSAPDEKPVTLASWANADAQDFTATALTELDGTSTTAGYGAPYNTADPGQKIGPVGLQKFAGVRHPVDTAKDFVLTPLATGPQPADDRLRGCGQPGRGHAGQGGARRPAEPGPGHVGRAVEAGAERGPGR
jgi:hypothetical protein